MERSFQPGDKVQHTSGHHPMTVERIEQNGEVVCSWMDTKGVLHKERFPKAVLQEYVAPSWGISVGRMDDSSSVPEKW